MSRPFLMLSLITALINAALIFLANGTSLLGGSFKLSAAITYSVLGLVVFMSFTGIAALINSFGLPKIATFFLLINPILTAIVILFLLFVVAIH
jgi:hypothetical protein